MNLVDISRYSVRSPYLKDRFGRSIEYVRVSVTDRCNLRCFYCSSYRNFVPLNHTSILTYEEILKILEVLSELGIKKVRITGGEPFVRESVSELLLKVKGIPGIERLTVTTNGTLLKNYVDILKKSRVDGINVSLDTLKAERFSTITGMPKLQDVIEGIKAAHAAHIPVKINTVYYTYNLDEVEDLVNFALELGIPLRFIELMPFDEKWKEHYVEEAVLFNELSRIGKLTPLETRYGDGPSRYYLLKTKGGNVQIGFISAISHNFCQNCSRIRLSADGNLIPCMASSSRYSLRDILRGSEVDKFQKLREVAKNAIFEKPLKHRMPEAPPPNEMRKLGG